MNRKARRAGKARGAGDSALRARLAEATACLGRGDAAAAAALIRAVLAADPRLAEAHYLLGTADLLQGRPDDAARCFRRAVELAPALPEAHNNLGVVLERQGLMEEAADCYRRAIALRAGYAEAHNNLGNALLALGRAEESVDSFRAAIAAGGTCPEACHNNLANVLAQLGRGEEAVAAYRRALALRPRFPEALNNLSALLCELGRPAEAVEACLQAIAIDPALPESHFNLGTALRNSGRTDDAIAAFRQAARLRPGDADSHVAIANILQRHGRTDEAQRLFRHAHGLRPLGRRAGTKAKADFSVLVLAGPGVANTPSDYLVGRAGYDSYFVAVMEGVEYDLALLRRHADVVLNLICDADQGSGILPLAVRLVEAVGRPTLNHPATVMATGREAIARRLAGIPRCRVPRTIRLAGAALAAPHTRTALEGFAFPLLVRVSGAHGGDEFEKLDDPDAVAAFAAPRAESDLYVTEYVDYRSADGYFRKYRLIFVDGRILPYHLAIADQWKVHHFRTDMASHEWMRREEEAFVVDPASVFDAGHWQALQAIGAAVGLDYFGIDCALDRTGDLVVFEVNASMLVHGETSTFAYKEPYIARIKTAFDAMLAKAAGRPEA